MSQSIFDYIGILNNNKISPRQRDIPEDIDNKEELLKELEQYRAENEQLPDSCFDFTINGYTSPVELEDFLEEKLIAFKIGFGAVQAENKDEIKRVVLNQLEKAELDLENLKINTKHLEDISLDELFQIKIKYIKQTVEYFKSLQSKEIVKVKPKKKPEYYFTVKKEYYLDGDAILQRIYKKLLSAGYIESCTESQFKKLFYFESQQGKRKTPSPIIWSTGKYNELAYFIYCLIDKLLTRSNKPPRYESAVMLFHNQEKGKLFKDIKKGKLQYDGNLREESKKIIDEIVKDSIKRPT